jgi:hypothetical protein
MIARPNQIAEEKGGGKSVRKIDKEGSRSCVRVQGGTDSLCFSTSDAAWLLQNPQEGYNFSVSAQKKEIPVKDSATTESPHLATEKLNSCA